jgi:gamma-glutamylcysteine synthetase
MREIVEHIVSGFEAGEDPVQRRIGAELKFPMVNADGTVATREKVVGLWRFLADRGWTVTADGDGPPVGATQPGPQNETIASCETGYPKTEFSLAHVGDLFELEEAVGRLRETLRDYSEAAGVSFIGYGIVPADRPRGELLHGGERTVVWDTIFGANRVIPPEDGDDVALFTINAASHVHVSVHRDEAIPALNAINGFSGPQIALTADSNIWKGLPDGQYKCVAEKLWDWWMPDSGRVGVPRRPFESLRDYAAAFAELRPVYVRREGRPVLLSPYESLHDYFADAEPAGVTLDGETVPLAPAPEDIDLHTRCCWHNARLTRFHTVENRLNDQQPPEDLLTISAMTLGLVEAVDEAAEELAAHDWDDLRAGRETACRHGLDPHGGVNKQPELAGRLLEIVRAGLGKRGRGEERFLQPLEERLRAGRCPADQATDLYEWGGVEALVAGRAL